jgi:transcriptional regulator with XRE-family HTH domain
MAATPWTEETLILIGNRLKRTRAQQGLSIRQVAERAGVSKTTVVQVESGKTSRRASYVKVAEIYGLHVERLAMAAEPRQDSYAVHRASDEVWFNLAAFDAGPLSQEAQNSEKVRRELAQGDPDLAPLSILSSRLEQGRIKPTILELYGQSPARSHQGEEFVFVLSGDALVTVGDSELKLSAGESVTFWSAEAHAYAPQPGSALPVRILSVRVDS